MLIITDTLGNVVHQKQWYQGLTCTGLRYRQQDSTFLFWGYHYLGNYDYEAFLMRTNFWGDTIWSNTYNPTSMDFCRNALELPDGSVLMCGTSRLNPNDNIVLIKTDALGNQQWVKYFNYDFKIHDTFGLLLQPDGSVLVGYNAKHYYQPNQDTTILYWDGYGLINIDTAGNILRDTFYLLGAAQGKNWQGWMVSLPNNLVAFTAFKEVIGIDFAFVAVNTQTLAIEWITHIPEYIGHFTTNHKGNIVGCGNTLAYDLPGIPLLPWIFEIDGTTGEILWERFVLSLPDMPNYEGLSSLEFVRPTKDGGYILTGRLQTKPPGADVYAWLLKIDSAGCLQPGCDSLLVTVPVTEPKEETAKAKNLRVQPNPADAILTVSVGQTGIGGQLRLFDTQGRMVSNVAIGAETITIPTQQLAAGLYWAQCVASDGRILGTAKVVVQH